MDKRKMHLKREVKPGKNQDNKEQSSKILKGKKSRASSPHGHKAKKKKIHEDSDDDDQEDGPSEADFWRGPPQDVEEKTREEEFDEYFQDLFL
ncbi:hypothetical protein E2320_008449 [Naja naja]|nr:hypothetical protein E2320_008449 [Naja naja]